MKKILMAIFVVFLLFLTPKVKAKSYKLTLEKQDNIYYVRDGDILPPKTSQFSIYKMDNILAYCIEPRHNITTFNYQDGKGEIDLPYSDEIKEKIELIGYYGREYPNHNNVRYSMATQALIWELTGTGKVSFWTGKEGTGNKIDIQKERDEIMNLVNAHKNVPNLPKEIYVDYGVRRNELDSSGLLQEFEVLDSDGLTVSINKNNYLLITSNKIGESTIKLTRKSYDNLHTLLFVGEDKDNSQTIARLRMSYKTNYEIKVITNGIRLKINKVDDNNQNILMKGIKFKIKDLNKDEYLCENDDCIFETNDKGYFLTDFLPFGQYEIEEIDQFIPGYTINNKKQIIDLNKNTPTFWSPTDNVFSNVNFVNKKIKGNIIVTKYGEEEKVIDNNITYHQKELSGIKFKIYDEKDHYIGEIITNELGVGKYNNLELGKYYLIEDNTFENYVLNNEKIPFEIKQENQLEEIINVNLKIENKLKKGKLEFFKEDKDTKMGIPHTIIEIYKDDDTLYLTKETDSKGKIVIDNMPLGKYYLIEKEANKAYLLTNERIDFEIKENNEIIKRTLVNQKREIIVPKTSKNDQIVVLSFSSLLFIFGLGGLFYEKKTI